MPPQPTSWISILISLLCLCLPSGLLPPGLHTETLYAPSLYPIGATCPAYRSFWSDHPGNIRWGVLIIKNLVVLPSTLRCYLALIRTKYLPTHPILKRPRPTFPHKCEFHTHTKQQTTLQSCVFWSLYFWIANWKTKDPAPNDSKHSLTSIWT